MTEAQPPKTKSWDQPATVHCEICKLKPTIDDLRQCDIAGCGKTVCADHSKYFPIKSPPGPVRSFVACTSCITFGLAETPQQNGEGLA